MIEPNLPFKLELIKLVAQKTWISLNFIYCRLIPLCICRLASCNYILFSCIYFFLRKGKYNPRKSLSSRSREEILQMIFMLEPSIMLASSYLHMKHSFGTSIKIIRIDKCVFLIEFIGVCYLN